MSALELNFELARLTVEHLAEWGVTEVCLCPGRRSAPFVLLLEKISGLRVYSFFDERSAAFFALGCSKRTGRLTAVCTTSGTACAELLPAAVEAYYGGIPLVFLTCDRPRRLRGTGAPQTIHQPGIFGIYVSHCIDLEARQDIKGLRELRPPIAHSIHLNICFDEPIIGGETPAVVIEPRPVESLDASVDPAPVETFLEESRRPLVIVGPLRAAACGGTERFLTRLRAPVLLEAPSQLQGSRALAELAFHCPDQILPGKIEEGGFDRVLRIGGVPACRLWRDLDEGGLQVPTLSVSSLPFPGLAAGRVVCGDVGKILDAVVELPEIDVAWRENVLSIDRKAAIVRTESLALEPQTELAMVHALSRIIPPNSRVYLGNSLPIREWDKVWLGNDARFSIEVNRGANGIDGQLSTFLGWSNAADENWALVGDLTALYDLQALWCVPQLARRKIRIVVINNGGGQIFAPMFSSELFLNRHNLEFSKWAAMFGFEYQKWTVVPVALPALQDRQVIELAVSHLTYSPASIRKV